MKNGNIMGKNIQEKWMFLICMLNEKKKWVIKFMIFLKL